MYRPLIRASMPSNEDSARNYQIYLLLAIAIAQDKYYIYEADPNINIIRKFTELDKNDNSFLAGIYALILPYRHKLWFMSDHYPEPINVQDFLTLVYQPDFDIFKVHWRKTQANSIYKIKPPPEPKS